MNARHASQVPAPVPVSVQWPRRPQSSPFGHCSPLGSERPLGCFEFRPFVPERSAPGKRRDQSGGFSSLTTCCCSRPLDARLSQDPTFSSLALQCLANQLPHQHLVHRLTSLFDADHGDDVIHTQVLCIKAKRLQEPFRKLRAQRQTLGLGHFFLTQPGPMAVSAGHQIEIHISPRSNADV